MGVETPARAQAMPLMPSQIVYKDILEGKCCNGMGRSRGTTHGIRIQVEKMVVSVISYVRNTHTHAYCTLYMYATGLRLNLVSMVGLHEVVSYDG